MGQNDYLAFPSPWTRGLEWRRALAAEAAMPAPASGLRPSTGHSLGRRVPLVRRPNQCLFMRGATISGFPRYQQTVASLLPAERAKITALAQAIIASYKPGCQPVQLVRVTGHADSDPVRERQEPGFVLKISQQRAALVKQSIDQQIRNPAVRAKLHWDVQGKGAAQLVYPNPRNETQRALNRRVEVVLDANLWCSLPLTSNREFNIWLQSSLNRALRLNLPLTGQFDDPTRAALNSFQVRNRLPRSSAIQYAAISALALVSRLPLPCQLQSGDDCNSLNCPAGQISGKKTVSLKGGTAVFNFCWTTLGFNPTIRGEVDLVGQKKDRLRFSCRRDGIAQCPEGISPRSHPAWKYQGVVGGTGNGLGNVSDWQFSFIQTVRSSRWLAIYSGGLALECVINNARDGLNAKGQPDSPPWFCAGAVQELCSGKTAVIEDSPAISFPIKHPQDSTQELRKVCFKAKFEIWLGVKRKSDSAANTILLWHKHIEVDRMWSLRSGGIVTGPSSWLFFGGQRESASAANTGPTTPVFGGSTANQQAVSCPKPVTQNATCTDPGDFPGQLIKDGSDCPSGDDGPLFPCVPD